ncbi:hypothetical protein FRP1_12715 [Pseudonocardia sp. EC080625-04]|uniref:hypothetical protein n=1 Tax=Pseudonocardia sp. EC080625-04 TaxID=1096868 RepID=UPI0006CB1264|nr:hypothetical protein [Pseudonocardia sp. EC080625-04]ALE73698.1 hypothetical protein FRP1_12715 [Pseudonocardia sp. EC080625-04]
MFTAPQTTRPGTGPVTTARGARRGMIVLVVASLVVASLLGIVALLTGEFGELQGRIVVTTLVVAAFGTTALCHLAVVTRAVRAVGFGGLAASLGAAVCALVLIWQDWSGPGPGEGWWKSLALLTIAAVSLAHANLLLLLAGRPHPAIRTGLAVTLAAIAVVAVMLAIPVVTDGEIPGSSDEWYWRWFGVAGIVDALGTIALPVLGLVLRRPEPVTAPGAPAPEPAGETVRLVLDLPADLAHRLDDHAGGGSRENAALDVLHRGLPTG